MAAQKVQDILERLLLPDNTTIQQATRDLQAVYRDPAIIPALCDLLLSSQTPQIRQYAALLLRKRLIRLWIKLPADSQQRIKAMLLQCLAQEKVHLVVVSLAHLVGVIARYELGRGRWVELTIFIQQHCQGPEPVQREVAMLLLSSLMESAAAQLHPQFPSLLALFSVALDDSASKMVPYYAIKSLTAMVEYIGDDYTPLFRGLIPKIMAFIRVLIVEDEDKACEAMELFDELVECEVAIVMPHLIPLIQLCLEVASNRCLGNNVRVKALSFISWLASLKRKTLLKQGLLPTIIQTMLTIMASPGEGEEMGGPGEAVQSHSPIALAAQVLDVLCIHFPPDKVFTPVLQQVEPWLGSEDQLQRAAGLIAIAFMAEGCAEHIRNNHLQSLLDVVFKGINDSEQLVRNAALFAIGQFSEHLQPDICQFSDNLLPVLFQLVDSAISSHQRQLQDTGLTKVFYALETFCEQLGSNLLPYLQPLMDKLFLALTVANDVHIRELAISAIGAVANACQEQLLPYFPRIIEVLKEFIAVPFNPELATLQAQAVDTLGVLARTIGSEHFCPLAHECILLGASLMKCEDPDLRRAIYGMFASVSCVLREEMVAHLSSLVPHMMVSLTSEEGVTVHYAASQMSFLDFDDEEEGEVDLEGDVSLEDRIEGVSVENAYLEEKEDTCNALGEIAENVGSGFLPFIDDCYQEMNVLSEHSSEDIRKAAITGLGRLTKVWYRGCPPEEKDSLHVQTNLLIGSLAATVRTDAERYVAIATLETLEDLLRCLRELSFPLAEAPLESLLVSVHDVLEMKAQCQGDEEEGPPGDELAELDGVLIECAGSVLGPLVALVGGHAFLPRLKPLVTLLLRKLQSPNASTADRSFAVGTFAEVVEGLGASAGQAVELYPVFMASLADLEDEVCSNAVYGLGVLAANAHAEMHSRYPEVLQSLFVTGRSRGNGRVADNVCASICRMITARRDSVPLEQVLPAIVQSLPLKEDMEENTTVYSCLLQLFEAKDPVMMASLPQMLRVLAVELSPASKLTKELQLQLLALLRALNAQCPGEMAAAIAGLSQEQLAVLQQAATTAAPTA